MTSETRPRPVQTGEDAGGSTQSRNVTTIRTVAATKIHTLDFVIRHSIIRNVASSERRIEGTVGKNAAHQHHWPCEPAGRGTGLEFAPGWIATTSKPNGCNWNRSALLPRIWSRDTRRQTVRRTFRIAGSRQNTPCVSERFAKAIVRRVSPRRSGNRPIQRARRTARRPRSNSRPNHRRPQVSSRARRRLRLPSVNSQSASRRRCRR